MPGSLPKQIDLLKSRLLEIGALVEQALDKAFTALVNHDRGLAVAVIESDEAIDRMEVEFEEECLATLALFQPVAADLRFVVTALKINNDLERMGDLAKNIAKRVVYLTGGEMPDLPHGLHDMGGRARLMIKRSLDALVHRDVTLARRVCDGDDELDALRKLVHRTIFNRIRERPRNLEPLIWLDAISKHLERLGDLATNIAEDVNYMVEGHIVRHQAAV